MSRTRTYFSTATCLLAVLSVAFASGAEAQGLYSSDPVMDQLMRQYDQKIGQLGRQVDGLINDINLKERECRDGNPSSCAYLYVMPFHPERLRAMCNAGQRTACQKYNEYAYGARMHKLDTQSAIADRALKYQRDRAQSQRDRWHEQALQAKGDSELWKLLGRQLRSEGKHDAARRADWQAKQQWNVYQQYRRK